MALTTLLARASHLLGLVFTPQLLSPEPIGEPSGLQVALGAIALIGFPIFGLHLYRRYPAFEAKLAAGAWVIATGALWYGAAGSAPHVPLLASYYTTAPFVWIALALTAATLAGEYLGTSFRNKKMGAGLITIAIAVFIYRDAHKLVASPTEQWLDVLKRDPANARAFHEVRPALAADAAKFEAALTACLERDPGACHCRVERASSFLLVRNPKAALDELERSSCAATDARADRLSSLAKALVLDRAGQPAEALVFARRAVDAGAGRDAKLLLGALLIAQNELKAARPLLEALATEYPDDADVAYDLGLIADKEGRYNEAREAYLKALRLRPGLANARYNLVMLTRRYGFDDEARSHARRFQEAFPEDPRGPELSALASSPR